MTLSVLIALALAALLYFVSTREKLPGYVKLVAKIVAVLLLLAPAEAAIHWVRGFLPGFLGA